MCCAYVRKVHCAVVRIVRTTGALLFFRYLLRLRRHKRKSVEVGVFGRVWVTSRLNFRLKDYFFAPISIDSQIGEWPYYKCAAGSFHTKKFCSRLYSIDVKFYSKNEKNRTKYTVTQTTAYYYLDYYITTTNTCYTKTCKKHTKFTVLQ